MTKTLVKPLVLLTTAIAFVASVLTIALTPSSAKALPIDTTGQPTLGNAQAPAHIVVFEDLKCPNCRELSVAIFPQIKKKYIDTGKAKYTLILLAFIPGSIPAGNAALCLRDQNEAYFFPFVEYLYRHQPSEEKDWATLPTLLKFAHSAAPNANLQKLSNCIFTNTHTATLKNNLNLAAKLMGNQVETPTVYVNGQMVRPLTMEKIETLIQAAQ